MDFKINQIRKEVNYVFSSCPRHDMISMSKAQTYWLIERVEELEGRNTFLEKAHLTNVKISEYGKEDKQRYKQALEFYADAETYKVNVTDQWEPRMPIGDDNGDKAREALKEASE